MHLISSDYFGRQALDISRFLPFQEMMSLLNMYSLHMIGTRGVYGDQTKLKGYLDLRDAQNILFEYCWNLIKHPLVISLKI